uniref:Uncharacterized protein n=1 Tax=viral metagenome TaxID=1070528 RepID=A0A6M3IWE8_9ZZZZ
MEGHSYTKELMEMKGEIKDIRENHLMHIYDRLGTLEGGQKIILKAIGFLCFVLTIASILIGVIK